MDWSQFSDAAVAGVPLFAVVLGLVEYAKTFGAKGNALRIISLAVGLVLGNGYQISALGLPANFAGWFAIEVYGLALGLVASGVYQVGDRLAARAAK